MVKDIYVQVRVLLTLRGSILFRVVSVYSTHKVSLFGDISYTFAMFLSSRQLYSQFYLTQLGLGR